MIDTPRHSRRLLLLFLATTLVPAVCLGWLGWSVVVNDRQAQRDAVDGERERTADLAASAFKNVLAEAEERLTSFDAAPASGAQDVADGIALVALGGAGVLERAGTLLPYYPVSLASPAPDFERFAAVNELVYQKKDYVGALRVLEAMLRSETLAVSGDVLLRIAVIRGRLGNARQALEAFTALETLGDTPVAGRPAAVVARHGRALLFERAERFDDLRREAAAMCADLESGRWVISRDVFESLSAQARIWLGDARPRIDPDRLALAEAAASLWSEWQGGGAPSGRGRRTLHVNGVPVLVLTRSTPERHTALMMTPRYMEAAWLGGLNPETRAQGIDFALTDTEGETVLGRPEAPTSMQSTRPATTPVPWNLLAISRPTEPTRMSRQTTLVLAGILMTGLFALAGGYAINRALLRELRVARLQSDFVAAVSHEFRTPLTTVRQLSELLAKGRVSSDERRQQFYETLLGESTRLQRLVEGLLNFGRMEAGQLQYRFEPVDPEEFVRGIVSEFEKDVAGRGYHIELHGNGVLPPIRADRESLARVFWNLLDNAVKYSPDSRTVWVDLSEAGRRLAVRVRDRGIGIPAGEQKEIFRKFVRGAASTHASIQGTGVGLAMAHQIVAAHGGDISVESRPGEGSVFTVLLPVAKT